MLRLVLGIEVIQIAEELIEAVRRGEKLIPISEMVLTKLACGVAERF